MALLKRSSPAGKSQAEPDPEGRMPLMDHLRELRNRLVKAMAGLVIGTIVGFVFFDRLWVFMTGPYCRLPQAHELKNECTLVVQGVFEGFMVNLQVALMFGAVVSAPIWLYQVWAFVTPGLYRNERRYSITFLGLAVPLFVAGAGLAYITMDKGLALLLGFAPNNVIPMITMSEYVGYLMAMLVIFGLSFELPLLMVFLNLIGVLRFHMVRKHQRMVVFLMFLFAAVATPSQDPITMLALAVPMVGMFMIAEVFMYFNDRKREQQEAQRQRELAEELDGPGASVDTLD
ncbi:Sec-independent protein translocase protein TatC [Sphaerisporangium siamense]|uniref:Sec-independent protein translocase protein TatC n=1 Tax=Sphaerisporangium siamense TaxID=795645 RepID=A0A7W7GA60_9ACTN|nr:twin-arginine translocase subunit TatC [Sphaerisporangium siamense]MBB4703583.1 sec-independent protein translocase protein TatC [Sphaerisporangium siamense]GII82054.1 Sec-independent protein translocase protein TatC [Sphaerisporangium siamense]